jgi:hypothetical protein
VDATGINSVTDKRTARLTSTATGSMGCWPRGSRARRRRLVSSSATPFLRPGGTAAAGLIADVDELTFDFGEEE